MLSIEVKEKILGLKTLDIDLFPKDQVNEEKYNIKRLEFINDNLSWRKREKSEVEWELLYPRGYKDWKNDQLKLTSAGQQNLINKVDEIVGILKSLTEVL